MALTYQNIIYNPRIFKQWQARFGDPMTELLDRRISEARKKYGLAREIEIHFSGDVSEIPEGASIRIEQMFIVGRVSLFRRKAKKTIPILSCTWVPQKEKVV